MSAPYCPKRGDIVWLTFTPQVGHEQAGYRPALIVSPEAYNKKVGLALVCPITTQVKATPLRWRFQKAYRCVGSYWPTKSRVWIGRRGELVFAAPCRRLPWLRS